MNIGRSIEVAMTQNDKNSAWLADQLNLTVTRVNVMRNSTHANTKNVERISRVFGMEVSDFVALGED